MKVKKEVLQHKFLIMFGLQVTIATIYYSLFGYDVQDRIVEALYYYPISSCCIFLLNLLGISFWVMSLGYNNLLSIIAFSAKKIIV